MIAQRLLKLEPTAPDRNAMGLFIQAVIITLNPKLSFIDGSGTGIGMNESDVDGGKRIGAGLRLSISVQYKFCRFDCYVAEEHNHGLKCI